MYTKQLNAGVYDASHIIYCGRPKNHILEAPVIQHFGNQFAEYDAKSKSKQMSSAIYISHSGGVDKAKELCVMLYYWWLMEPEKHDSAYQDISGEPIVLSALQPERRKFILDHIPFLYHRACALGCWCYDAEPTPGKQPLCHTYVLRALTTMKRFQVEPRSVLSNEFVERLNGSAFGRPYYETFKPGMLSNTEAYVDLDELQEGVDRKFSLGTKAAATLVATGERELVKWNMDCDNFYGWCLCSNCTSEEHNNYTGRAAMTRREALFEELEGI